MTRKIERKISKENSRAKTRLLNVFNATKKRHFKKDYPKRKHNQRDQKGQNGDATAIEDEGYEST